MTDPLQRLTHVCRVLARPVAARIAAGCAEPNTYTTLGACVQRKPTSVRAALQALLTVGAVSKPEGAYLERALEAGQLTCSLPALLRGLADEIEAMG